MKKQEFKKMRRGRNLQDFFKSSNIRIIGVPDGEEEQEIENLFEQITKENMANLVKEIDFQEVQEAQSPKEVGPKGEHTKAHHDYITKIKDERILKAAREKEMVTYRGVPMKLSAEFSKETLQARKGWKRYSKSWKARTYIKDYSIQQSYHLEWKGR